MSWAAKFHILQSDRRVLGGHAKPKDFSVLEYSKDAMAGPLQKLEIMLRFIREGKFSPDAIRSGRFKVKPSGEARSFLFDISERKGTT